MNYSTKIHIYNNICYSSFRLLDLLVIYLFINNRKVNTLTDEEKQIIGNIKIDFEKYSDEKRKKIIELQNMILNYN